MKHALLVLLLLACDGEPALDAAVDDAGAGDADVDAGAAARDDVLDRDDDGLVDSLDAFPDDPTEQLDSDGDGTGNFADLDEDGDGAPDVDDEAPFDPALSRYRDVDEAEPNDDTAQDAGAIALRIAGTVATGDIDRFAIALAADTLASAVVYGDVTIELADASGAPRAHIEPHAGRAIGAGDALAYYSAAGETVELVVRGESAYELVVFGDRDLDAVDDERERAFSADAGSSDPDGDGVYDGSEIVLAPFDPDGDGAPSWRDIDADGDGIADRVETDADPDVDGISSHLDEDSDGDGTTDADVLGGSVQPRDLDADGSIDAIDLDDDGDGLSDRADAAPAAPEATYDLLAPDRVLVASVASRMPDGTVVEGVARGGATLIVRGEGFGTDPSAVELVLEDDGDASTRSLSSAITDDRIELALDPDASVSRVWVRVDARRSNGFAVHASRDGEPLLVRFEPAVVDTFAMVTAHGYDLEEAALVGDGDEGMSIVSQDATTIVFSSRAYSEGGVVARSVSAGGIATSNRIPLLQTRTGGIFVSMPAGASITLADLTVTGGDGRALALTAGRNTVLPVAEGRELITATYPDASGADSLYLMTLSPYGRLDVTGTAVTLIMLSSDILNRPGQNLSSAFSLASALPEVRDLVAHLEPALAANPRFFDAPDAMYTTLFEAAAVAFRERVILETASEPAHPPATITEEQYDVLVRESEGGGNVSIENDSMLYLSARVIDAEDESLFYRDHITSYLDPDIIGTQSGAILLFNASSVDLNVPNYNNSIVEVITPGIGPGLLPDDAVGRDARFFLMLRTFVDRGLCPILQTITGLAAPNNLILAAVLQQLPDAVQSARNLYVMGSGAAALEALWNAIKADIENIGLFTQAIAFALGVSLITVLDQFARKIASALVPVFGQIASAAQAVAEGANLAGIGKYFVDTATMPPVLTFNVTWDLFVEGAVPNYIEATSGDRRIYVSGADFSPAIGTDGSEVLPEVTIGDYTTRPQHVAPDGRDMTVILPRSVIQAHQGERLDLTVRHRGEEATARAAIHITNRFSLDELDPPHGWPGQEIILRGGVFSGDPSRVQVYFSDSSDLTALSTTFHRAPLISTSTTEIRALIPREVSATEGERTWWVHATVGPAGFPEATNLLEFHLAVPGTWMLRRTATSFTPPYVDHVTLYFSPAGNVLPDTGNPTWWGTSWYMVTPERAHVTLDLQTLVCCPSGHYQADIELPSGRITGTFQTNNPSPRTGTIDGRWYPH